MNPKWSHVTRGCGCVAWSEDLPHLIVSWCPEHLAKIEAENEAMREKAMGMSAESVILDAMRIAEGLRRMGS